MADRVIQRHDTAARWQSVNPVLAEGELGIEIDGAKGYKIGDGVTTWNNLEYPANPTSIVQEFGNNENAAISQKAFTQVIDCYNVSKYNTNDVTGDPAFGTNKFTLEQALSKVPNTFRYAGMSVRFVSSITNVIETWLYRGTLSWEITTSFNWVNTSAIILNTNIPITAGMVNAKVENTIPFLYKNGFGINYTTLSITNWELGYYYNLSGDKVLQNSATPFTYKAGSTDISSFAGGTLFVIAQSAEIAYICIKNSTGSVIAVFQTPYGSSIINIPTEAATLCLSNRFQDLPDQYVSIQASPNSIYLAAKEVDMQVVKQNTATRNLPLIWKQGEYWNGSGLPAATATYSRTEKFDVTSYIGKTLIFFGQVADLAYIITFNSSGAVLKGYQTTNNLVSIPITSDVAYIGFSNRHATIAAPYCTLGDFIKAASLEDLNRITSVIPLTNYPILSWEQGGISNDGTSQDEKNSNYPTRIRTTASFEVANSTVYLNINSGFGYRVFEYTPDGTFVTWQGNDSGGYNTYTLSNPSNKLKFCILYSNNSEIDTSVVSEANFVVEGLKLLNQPQLAPLASVQYVNEEISKKTYIRNKLTGKKVSFIGDSITAGTACTSTPYHKVFCDLYGCVDNPLGVGGTCIANNTKNGLGSQRFITRATVSNLQDSSLIVVFGGTNDFSYDSKPVGNSFVETSITPTGNIGSRKLTAPTDTDTFTGALHELITTIRTNCPTVPIVFVAPLQRGRYNANNPNSDETNANGNYLSDFTKAIKEICSFYSIPVLDLGSVSELDFMNTQIATKYSSDNLHPNCAGHALIGELLFRFVEDNVIIN
nr:MAG TPA: hyaluronidase [Crassvirales sp.]